MSDVKRTQRDGRVAVNRFEDTITIVANDDNTEQVLHVSEYNARRVLAMLALILELPLSKAAQKEIKL